jgi:hypothetical protein
MSAPWRGPPGALHRHKFAPALAMESNAEQGRDLAEAGPRAAGHPILPITQNLPLVRASSAVGRSGDGKRGLRGAQRSA